MCTKIVLWLNSALFAVAWPGLARPGLAQAGLGLARHGPVQCDAQLIFAWRGLAQSELESGVQ